MLAEIDLGTPLHSATWHTYNPSLHQLNLILKGFFSACPRLWHLKNAGVSVQCRLHLHSFTIWPFGVSWKELWPLHILLGLCFSWNFGEGFHESLNDYNYYIYYMLTLRYISLGSFL